MPPRRRPTLAPRTTDSSCRAPDPCNSWHWQTASGRLPCTWRRFTKDGGRKPMTTHTPVRHPVRRRYHHLPPPMDGSPQDRQRGPSPGPSLSRRQAGNNRAPRSRAGGHPLPGARPPGRAHAHRRQRGTREGTGQLELRSARTTSGALRGPCAAGGGPGLHRPLPAARGPHLPVEARGPRVGNQLTHPYTQTAATPCERKPVAPQSRIELSKAYHDS